VGTRDPAGTPGTRHAPGGAGCDTTSGSYWNKIIEHWGSRRLDEPTPSQIRQLMTHVKTHVVARRNARSAQEHLIAAPRCLYQRAIEDGLTRLIQHGQQRHAPPDGQLLRYADRRPITSRRYDHLWTRLGRHLPWVRTQRVSTHWIRHTALPVSATPSPAPTSATPTAAAIPAPRPPTSAPACPRSPPPRRPHRRAPSPRHDRRAVIPRSCRHRWRASRRRHQRPLAATADPRPAGGPGVADQSTSSGQAVASSRSGQGTVSSHRHPVRSQLPAKAADSHVTRRHHRDHDDRWRTRPWDAFW